MDMLRNNGKILLAGGIRKIQIEARPRWLNWLIRRMNLVVFTDFDYLNISATRKKESIRLEKQPWQKELGKPYEWSDPPF